MVEKGFQFRVVDGHEVISIAGFETLLGIELFDQSDVHYVTPFGFLLITEGRVKSTNHGVCLEEPAEVGKGRGLDAGFYLIRRDY